MKASRELLKHYHTLILSPHLDDAALSCGGRIARLTSGGHSVLVVTITAGDPPLSAESDYIQRLHREWNLSRDAVAARRSEDEAACLSMGADWLHLPGLDCIYRFDPQTGRPLYDSDAAIFGVVSEADVDQRVAIVQMLQRLPDADHILAPLGVGNHVDHQLTRDAAVDVFGKGLCYYEEYPYAQECQAVARALANTTDWAVRIQPLTETDVRRRITASATYASQIEVLFGDIDRLSMGIREYVQAVGGERIWRRPGYEA